MNHFTHKKADIKDATLISSINNKRVDRKDQDGFVLDIYDGSMVIEKLEKGHVFYLIYNKELCVGFLELSYKKDYRIPSLLNWLDPQAEKIFNSKILYVERVCLEKTNHAKGAGKYIYQECIKTNAYCFIVEEPICNKKSIDFHRENNFNKVAQFNANEYAGFQKYQAGLYLKSN